MKKASLLSIILFLIIWELAALFIANSFILPDIITTIEALLGLLGETDLYIALVFSLVRTFVIVGLCFVFSLALATFAFKHPFFADFLAPFISMLKTIPTVSVLVILLLLVGRSGSIVWACLFVIFPIMYQEMLHGYVAIDEDIMRITSTFSEDFLIKWWRVYLPSIRNNIVNAIKMTLSLGFKVTVMAELLVQIGEGLGHELYFYRINLMTAEVFALTLIMIIVSFAFDKLLARIR